MSTRFTTYLLAAATAAVLAAAGGVATASSAGYGPAGAAKTPVIKIVMADPGCHWFLVAGKKKAALTVRGTTAFRNLDEAAITFVGKNYRQRVPVGKSVTIARPGTYHITMVGQHPDDNTLVLIVK